MANYVCIYVKRYLRCTRNQSFCTIKAIKNNFLAEKKKQLNIHLIAQKISENRIYSGINILIII